MRARWYVLLGVLGYAAALVVTAPASLLLDHVLSPLVPQDVVVLRRVTGTVLEGGAEVTIRGLRFGHCRWQFEPHSLLAGRLGFSVVLETAAGHLDGSIGIGPTGSVVVQGADGAFPVADLRGFMPSPLREWLAGGDVLLRLESAQVTALGLRRLDGTITWRDAELGLARDVALGDLRLVVGTQDEGVMNGAIEDDGGVIESRGNLVLTADGHYRGDVSLSVRPGGPAALTETLAMLGRPDANGRTTLVLSGSVF
jgi:hypothetical protein